MPNHTSRLKLVMPLGSEAFRRADFESNWGILDNFPGVQIVGSAASRPTTDASRGGTLLYQTAERYLVASEGTGWVPLRQYAFVTTKSFGTNDSIPKNTTHKFPHDPDPWTVNLPRAGGLMMFGTIRLAQEAALSQSAMYKFYVDNNDSSVSTADDQNTVHFPDSGAGASGSLAIPFAIFGYAGGLAKGDHNIQIRVSCGNDTNNAIVFSGCKVNFLYTDA